ncbi:MAG TPA: hypothetical protein VLS96_06925, partial [Nodosilinea sp.]|nr:hypothetical protein [Nodosilinea sp.]
EMLQINRREEVLTQTQQDMRRAIDYITRDAGEAVYIYSTPNAVVDEESGATLIEQLDDFPNNGEIPVLAFWRLDPLDPNSPSVRAFFADNPDCETAFPTEAQRNECTTLKVRQGYYTLVIYAQQANDEGDFWGGKARIVRYELPKYTSTGLPDLDITSGYSEPTGLENNFDSWTKGTGDTDGNINVLTDYLDEPADEAAECPAGYLATPADANNFYACVLAGTTTANPLDEELTVGSNQTLIVFLRGNIDSANSALGSFSNAGSLPTLRSEVLIRGVIDKQPGL